MHGGLQPKITPSCLHETPLHACVDARIAGFCWYLITERDKQVWLKQLCCCEVVRWCEGLVAGKALYTSMRLGALVPPREVVDVAVAG